MVRVPPLLIAALSTLLPLCAQEVRVAVVKARQAAAAPNSSAWFDAGFELVDALIDVDCAAALAKAVEVHDAAIGSKTVGLECVAAATVGLATAIHDGPKAAQMWFDRAGNLPGGFAPSLQARYWMARARLVCCKGDHSEEIFCAVPARAAAVEAKDPVLTIRATAVSSHIEPDRGLINLQEVFDAAVRDGYGAEIDYLQPWLTIEQQFAANRRQDFDESQRINDLLIEAGERLGNRRLLGFALANRANLLYTQKQRDRAMPIYQRVAEVFDRLGDRHQRFGIHNMLATAALQRDDFADAERRLDALREMIEGRGFAEDDRQLLGMRFELAVRQRHGDQAADLKHQIEDFDAAAEEAGRRTEELRQRLLSTEAQKAATEAQLLAVQQRAAERASEVRMFGAIAAAVALSLLFGVAWRSRRRLLVANRQLAEQMQRVEESQSAQRKLEDRMRELERTESLGTMAAGVAHDFNNLLTSILGSAELLREHRAQVDVGELAGTIQSAGEQAARLCRHLQSYAGGTPMHLAPVDLVELVRAMLPSLQAATRGTVELRLALPDAAVGALGDRAQLEQVLLNLVVNARDAGAKVVEIGVAARDQLTAEVIVRDDGHGMAPEVQQRIFDPFFTTRFPGRGLGLAVVHGVVRRHAGNIRVDSSPGAGARFAIELPSAPAPAATVAIPRPAVAVNARIDCAVVVVDDEAAVRDMLARMLQLVGITADCMGDGEAALAALAAVPAERRLVLFVDLTMPGMDGAEVVRRARALRATARIVLMSGHPTAYVEQIAADLAPDRVLGKPFTVEAVHAALIAVVGAETAADQGAARPSGVTAR